MINLNLDPQLITIKKAALKIGVEYRQLLKAVKNGLVPHYKIAGSRILISVPETLAVMKINKTFYGEQHES